MKDNPLVTAIVATYNRAEIVSRAIESILGQTYTNIELIVVDDGSTDNTMGVLGRFGSRLRILRQTNAGPGAARNRGIEHATGEIIAFLDSDDLWLPEKIECQVRLLQDASEAVPCCLCNAMIRFSNRPMITSFENACLDPPDQEGLWLNAAKVLISRFVLFNQSVAIRRSALKKIGGYDESLRYLEDYDLAMRLSTLGPFAFTSKPLVTYYQGSVGSLAEEALDKITSLREYEVQIRTRALEAANSAGQSELQTRMYRALTKARRRLWVARMGQRQTPGARAVVHAYERIARFRDAIQRRSPGFDKMKTVPLARRPASL